MEAQPPRTRSSQAVAAFVGFALIFVVIMLIAFMNAPIKLGPAVSRSLGTYLAETGKTGVPFLVAVGVLAALIGGAAARMIWREWPHLRRRRNLIAGYSFLAPYLLVTLTFTVGVILFALYISFNQYDIFTAPIWKGLENYVQAFRQQLFLQALHNVVWYAVIVTLAQTSLAIAMAVFLNAPMRFKQFFRTVFYAPSVTSSVVITLIFMWMYLKTGYINLAFSKVLGLIGVHWAGVDWLNDPRGLIQLIVQAFGGDIPYSQWYLKGPSIAWMCLMFQNIFTTVPTFMIMFLAALQDINPALYEAAAIDGANGWQQFWKITLPLLRPIVVLVLVLGTIGTLQIFDQVYLATAGGPLNTTQVPVYMIYTRAIGTEGPIQMGYASALAFILAVIIFVFTFAQRRLIERGTEMY
jgi:multiple sugar transport system permease protein